EQPASLRADADEAERDAFAGGGLLSGAERRARDDKRQRRGRRGALQESTTRDAARTRAHGQPPGKRRIGERDAPKLTRVSPIAQVILGAVERNSVPIAEPNRRDAQHGQRAERNEFRSARAQENAPSRGGGAA